MQPMSISAGQKGDREAVEADGDEDDAHDFSHRQARLTEAASPLMRLVSSFIGVACVAEDPANRG